MIKANIKFDKGGMKKSAKTGSIKSLGHAGAAIRLTARRTIKRSDKPSAPGSPPHTRKGKLKSAIKYAVSKEKQSVVIGPDAQVTGQAGQAHEFGGRYRKQNYQKRPFMGPALQQIKARLPSFWANSIRK